VAVFYGVFGGATWLSYQMFLVLALIIKKIRNLSRRDIYLFGDLWRNLVTLSAPRIAKEPEVDTAVDFRLHLNGCANLRASNTRFRPPDLRAAVQTSSNWSVVRSCGIG